MLSKEEIEQAKDDLKFFYEGDYITREMEYNADVLEDYIEQLETKLKKSETEKQKLIEKLEEQANRKIPLAEDGDYVQGHRDLARDLLEILEVENEQ